MSATRRALIALALALILPVLIGLTGAAQPQPPTVAAVAPAQPTFASLATPAPPTATSTPTPQPSPTLARREFRESLSNPKVAPTTFLPGQGPTLPGELVFSGRRIDVFVGRGTFAPEEVASMGIKAEHALSYIQKRFDVELRERVSVGVYNAGLAPSRGTRGIAYTHSNNVRIYYRSGEDTHNALVILSHELAHQLQATAYGSEAQARADLVLLEGLATWISGEYWLSLSESPSFHARARELYQAGYRGSLRGLNRVSSDVAYEMWAGFVDYLARTYGWDKFNALYVSGRGRAPGSADYRGIYGKSFDELAAEFQATLQ